ncbi:MAG: NUDIX hydrolase [Clostridiaceae bacterium]|nr:NUDIX hydrolase [Clostridiaceae bacterium]
MIPHETATKKEYVYRGKIINVRRDEVVFPNGKESTREIVEHRGAVAVAAVDEEGCIYLVRQFRYAFGEELLEIPAGKLEEGEETAHLEAAIRELREETGLTAQQVDYLGVIYPSVGMLTERIHIYLARGLTQGEMDLDEDEFLNVERIPVRELEAMVRRGEIRDAKTISTLFLIQDKI